MKMYNMFLRYFLINLNSIILFSGISMTYILMLLIGISVVFITVNSKLQQTINELVLAFQIALPCKENVLIKIIISALLVRMYEIFHKWCQR